MQTKLAYDLFDRVEARPLKSQLLKWIGNKQRFAQEIISLFPTNFNAYFEPFLGSGAVLATLEPEKGYGSDAFMPLIEIWQQLKNDPDGLIRWYTERYWQIGDVGKEKAYEAIKASYNEHPNGADFLFLSRACYGGVVRFRQKDGFMSTPCGVHVPISPQSFSKRVVEWHERVQNTEFRCMDFSDATEQARKGDLIYCDPPYSYSQGIVYGAQSFKLSTLITQIEKCKQRGVYVALSIDGTKKSGDFICDLAIPHGLFEREVSVNTGKSMLRRFQLEGETLENEHVTDRLLLTY